MRAWPESAAPGSSRGETTAGPPQPTMERTDVMAIPTKGVNNIRTLSGRVDQLSLPYRSYMQITCLEMEKARRGMERKSASQRIALIDARLDQIEQAKQDLLQT